METEQGNQIVLCTTIVVLVFVQTNFIAKWGQQLLTGVNNFIFSLGTNVYFKGSVTLGGWKGGFKVYMHVSKVHKSSYLL